MSKRGQVNDYIRIEVSVGPILTISIGNDTLGNWHIVIDKYILEIFPFISSFF